MDRRTALQTLAASASALLLPGTTFAAPPALGPGNVRFGWTEDRESLASFIKRNDRPYIRQLNAQIKGSGEGKKAFLHLPFERITGRPFVAHDQGAPDCVSQAAALAVDFLSAVQIVTNRKPERWVAKAATEPIYAGSRVEIGGYDGAGGGSTGHWAAEWLVKFGVLLRQKYPGGYDYTTYDAAKANRLSRTGCPDPLEPIAKLHPVKKTAICTSYSDMCDCIYNGSPVMVCSNVGFGNGAQKRDREGFLKRQRSPWYHAMLFGGYDDEYRRPGGLCFNSWGTDWITGTTRGPQPEGTFWIDAATIDAMLRQGDSFAFSAYVGFPRVIIPNYILH